MLIPEFRTKVGGATYTWILPHNTLEGSCGILNQNGCDKYTSNYGMPVFVLFSFEICITHTHANNILPETDMEIEF